MSGATLTHYLFAPSRGHAESWALLAWARGALDDSADACKRRWRADGSPLPAPDGAPIWRVALSPIAPACPVAVRLAPCDADAALYDADVSAAHASRTQIIVNADYPR